MASARKNCGVCRRRCLMVQTSTDYVLDRSARRAATDAPRPAINGVPGRRAPSAIYCRGIIRVQRALWLGRYPSNGNFVEHAAFGRRASRFVVDDGSRARPHSGLRRRCWRSWRADGHFYVTNSGRSVGMTSRGIFRRVGLRPEHHPARIGRGAGGRPSACYNGRLRNGGPRPWRVWRCGLSKRV